MQMSSPTVYTDITQAQWDAFRYQARARGLNIGSNVETVEFDKVPIEVNYNPDTKTLSISSGEPHWLTPGVTIGVLHGMVAVAMMNKGAVQNTGQTGYLNQKTPESTPESTGYQNQKAPESTGYPNQKAPESTGYPNQKTPESTGFSIVPPPLGTMKLVAAKWHTQALQTTGGTAPVTFALTSGKLPAGLEFSTDGVVSGKPTEVKSTEPATVTATDSSVPTAQVATLVLQY